MNHRRLFSQVSTLIFLLFVAEYANAAVTLSNLGVTPSSTACGKGTLTTNEAFTTGADGPYTLTSITYTLENAGGTYTVDLHNNSNVTDTPGSIITTLDAPVITSTGGYTDYTFPTTVGVVLSKNTTYWLVTTSTNCVKAIATSGEEPSGHFTYLGSKILTGVDLASGDPIWTGFASTGNAGIYAITTTGGAFEVESSPLSAEQNKDLTYSFCFENSNTQDATVLIEADIPIGTTFVSASDSYSITSTTVMWSFGSVQAGSLRQCVNMVVSVQAAEGSSLIENATIQSDKLFVPSQVTTTTTVVAPAPVAPTSDGGGGALGLMELFVAFILLVYRRERNSKI